LTYAAVVISPTPALSAPGGGLVVTRLHPLDLNRLPTIVEVTSALLGRSCRPRWYHVDLSIVPNGSSGWIAARAVRLYRVPALIVIDLATRTLRLYRSGRLVLRTPVGIGAPATPTPVGRFFVNERYLLTSDDGPFGPAALGISAHSDALEHAWVEQGPVALHGTDEPWSIGEAASHCCVHVPNPVMRRVFTLTPDGTPVIIEAGAPRSE